jgi:nitrogen regulatory protein PII
MKRVEAIMKPFKLDDVKEAWRGGAPAASPHEERDR